MDMRKQKNFGRNMNYGNIDVSRYTTGVAMESGQLIKINQYFDEKIIFKKINFNILWFNKNQNYEK